MREMETRRTIQSWSNRCPRAVALSEVAPGRGLCDRKRLRRYEWYAAWRFRLYAVIELIDDLALVDIDARNYKRQLTMGQERMSDAATKAAETRRR